MINPIGNTGTQAFAPQPVVVPEKAEPVARTESVQPRNAPSADSQRSDQKARRDEAQEAVARARKRAAEPETALNGGVDKRGDKVDIRT